MSKDDPTDEPEALSTDPADPEPIAAEAGRIDEIVDELPEDLDRGFVGPYEFPDNKRRRVPGLMYLGFAALVGALIAVAGDDAVLSNRGLVVGVVALALIGVYHLVAAVPLRHDENDALVAATTSVGFPVGHASAQLGWRGWLSRPTWRVLVYSAEDPPEQRGLVLIDAGRGQVIDQIVEANPEDWSQYGDDGLASAPT